MRMKWWLIASFLLTFSLVLTACGGNEPAQPGSSPDQTGEPIKVGYIHTRSGPFASFTQSTLEGIETTVKWINEEGGINGRPIEVIVRDDAGKPEDSARIAEQFSSDKQIVAILGPYTATGTRAVDPVARQGKIPFIPTTGAGYVPTGEGSDWVTVFNPNFSSASQAFIEMSLAKGLKKVATLNPTDVSGTLAEDLVTQWVEKYDLVSVARERYDPTALDVTPQLTKIKAANPDYIISYGAGESAAIVIRQARQVGLNVPINISHANAEYHFLDLIKDIPNDTVYTIFNMINFYETLPDNDPQKVVLQKFKMNYEQAYPNKKIGYVAGTGADMILILKAALTEAGADREKIREYLSQGNQNIVGTLSPSYNFTKEDRWGHDPKSLPIVTNRNGEWVLAQ